jgi:hypothetical protein
MISCVHLEEQTKDQGRWSHGGSGGSCPRCLNSAGARAVASGGIGGWLTPPTCVELTYSENRIGHSENYGNNSITKF